MQRTQYVSLLMWAHFCFVFLALIPLALVHSDYFQYQLKGISFLPRTEQGAYEQMPYEAITEEQYLSR